MAGCAVKVPWSLSVLPSGGRLLNPSETVHNQPGPAWFNLRCPSGSFPLRRPLSGVAETLEVSLLCFLLRPGVAALLLAVCLLALPPSSTSRPESGTCCSKFKDFMTEMSLWFSFVFLHLSVC